MVEVPSVSVAVYGCNLLCSAQLQDVAKVAACKRQCYHVHSVLLLSSTATVAATTTGQCSCNRKHLVYISTHTRQWHASTYRYRSWQHVFVDHFASV
jgi:hypothetical protein